MAGLCCRAIWPCNRTFSSLHKLGAHLGLDYASFRAGRWCQRSLVASCSQSGFNQSVCAFQHSVVQCCDLSLSPCRAIQDRDKAVYEAEELKALSREQQRRLLVAETTAEQESTLRQGLQLG